MNKNAECVGIGEFLRFPTALITNMKYKKMSLEAKLVYSLLLNRQSLSVKNNWQDQNGKIYLIYKRKEVAEALNISYKKTVAAFRELVEKGLLTEHRQGRGYPNILYLNDLALNCKNGSFEKSETKSQDMPKKPSYINNDFNYIENSRSVGADETLNTIFNKCELNIFSNDVKGMFIRAIERLYYSDFVRIGNSKLPQNKIREYLMLLTADNLLNVLDSMKTNDKMIKNPTGYLMSSIINAVCEEQSSLILSLPQDYISNSDLYAPSD